MSRLLPVLLLVAAVAVAAQGDVCPDGTRCSDGTCCMTVNKPYGCCPFLNGVCCADMLHCCPQGFQCDLQNGMCRPGAARHGLQQMSLLPRPWSGGGGRGHPVALARSAAPAAAAPAPAASDVCPDGKTSCTPSSTCCQLTAGGYACCPEANAVCCPDHIHCCPAGTKCDVKDRTCLKVSKHPILTLV